MAINKLKLITNNSQNVWFAFVVSSCLPSFWMSGLGCPSGTADKCGKGSSSQHAYMDMCQTVHRQTVLWIMRTVQNQGKVSVRRGQSSWLQGKYNWPCHCVGIWWSVYFTASLMSINCLLHSKQKLTFPVEITDLQHRKAQTVLCRVVTMLELISRGKNTAKRAYFRSAITATGFMHTA